MIIYTKDMTDEEVKMLLDERFRVTTPEFTEIKALFDKARANCICGKDSILWASCVYSVLSKREVHSVKADQNTICIEVFHVSAAGMRGVLNRMRAKGVMA